MTSSVQSPVEVEAGNLRTTMEELDLDSFIESHGASGFDEDGEGGGDDSQTLAASHRTVDEILLLNDSSSSSVGSPSPPSSPSSFSAAPAWRRSSSSHSVSQRQLPRCHTKNNSNCNPSTNYASPAQILSHSLSLDSKSDNNNEFSEFSLSRALTTTSLLPPLFSAVRSNAKPGAALAAAAAASRSIPTPHAAAIKSFKTYTASSLSRSSTASAVADDSTLSFDNADGVSDGADRGVNWVQRESLGASAESLLSVGAQYTDTISSFLSHEQRTANLGEVSSTSYAPLHFNSPAQIENDLDFHATSDIVLGSEGKNLPCSSIDVEDEDSQFIHADDEKEMIALVDLDVGNIEDEILKTDGITDVDNVISQSGDELHDSSSQQGVALIVEDTAFRSEGKTFSGDTLKIQKPSLKPLELAEEREKRQAFTGIHLEEGAAAQPMRLEGVRRGSVLLGYFDVSANNAITRTISSQAFCREHGFPQALAVHVNYIAVGMSKGVIIVTPSKYHPYHPDNMDTKMSVLGLQGDRPHASVTSMCFNQQGDLLFAGYANGHVSVWDVHKSSVLKVMNDLHKAAVVHMLYVGQDSPVTRQFIISGDSKGGVKLTRFSIVPWLNRFTFSSTELLNDKTGPVICASPLLSGDCHGGTLPSTQSNTAVSTSAIGSMMGGVIGGDGGWKNLPSVHEGVVVFVTHQASLVAKVMPTVEPYGQIPKPEGVAEGSIPYAAWKFISDSQRSINELSEKSALLAIAWDRRVQVAKLVKSELKVYGKWTLDSSAVGVVWLDDQMLVVLTSVGQLCLFAKDGILIHKTSFVVEDSRSDDLISCHTYFNNTYGNPQKAHHNCLAVRGASIYILGSLHLVVSRLLPWKERVEVLRRAGDWMGALNMAMMLYDGQAHGVIDLPRALDDVHETIMPYLAEVLLSYVDEVFSYIEVASGNQVGNSDQSDVSKSSSYPGHPDIKEQYIRVGGVAVEFCVHINRTDILFEEIFSKFCTAKHKETFLELLEPYILKDMLRYLPPAIMQALVEHYSTKGWLQRIEQCVLHMDISSLDFNQVVLLCREHRLHGALIYLFNKGLDDFRTPLEELFVFLHNCQGDTAAELGYRMLVYLKYCFQGLAFPPGQGSISHSRVASVKRELLQFLLEDSSASNSQMTATQVPFPNLRHLLEMDTVATLDVLVCAFDDGISKSSCHFENLSNMDMVELNDLTCKNEKLIQEIVDVLSVFIGLSYSRRGCSIVYDYGNSDETWPSIKDTWCIFEFIAHYVASQRAKVSRDILILILGYLTSEISIAPTHTMESTKRKERQLLALLEVVPETDWDAPHLLILCEKSHFHQACGFIHAIKHQHLASLDSYMKAVDEPIHAFCFIHYMLQHLHDEEFDAFRVKVISRISDLIMINRQGTLFLVVEHFYEQNQQILFSVLQSHRESLFLYLKTLIEFHSTGNLEFSCLQKGGETTARHELNRVNAFLEALIEFPKRLRNNPIPVTDKMTELYLELLCQYERESVLKFLETFESYRVENCLRLCQENGIIDGAAFLLERVGDVGSALLLILSSLDDKFVMLDAAIASEISDSGLRNINRVLKKKEVKDILDVVNSCIGLCQRNSPRLDSHESEYLWFQLLDMFSEPLMDEPCNKGRTAVEANISELVCKQDDGKVFEVKWKIPKSHKGARILRKLLSMFIKKIIDGMIGYVRLPRIMSKLLSDNGSQEFGDFKLTILGMLGTYDFERKILETAKSLIEDDSYYTMNLLKKGASHGYAPQSLLCCVCNCLVMKSSQNSSIRVFVCGHAMHVLCELQESESLVGGSSFGCPICVRRQKSKWSRSKSVFVDNGLVSNVSSRSNKVPGMVTFHLQQDGDVFENIYCLNPISRFELLSNLQKDQRSVQIENVPQLKLAPPAVYHEKVKKGTDAITKESISNPSRPENSSRSRHLRDIKMKVSSVKLPLRSNVSGKYTRRSAER